MKKITAVFLAVFFMSTGAVFADGPTAKFGRGLTNIVSAPGEYLVQMEKLRKDHDPFTMFFGGLAKGTVMLLARELGGIYELVTFLIPIPPHYKPLMQPPTTISAIQELES